MRREIGGDHVDLFGARPAEESVRGERDEPGKGVSEAGAITVGGAIG
jgi:hypothetical protein